MNARSLADELAYEYTACRISGSIKDRVEYWHHARLAYPVEVYMILVEKVKETGDVDRIRRRLLTEGF